MGAVCNLSARTGMCRRACARVWRMRRFFFARVIGERMDMLKHMGDPMWINALTRAKKCVFKMRFFRVFEHEI